MAILFITTGLIGSAKSMIAEFISKEFNAEQLSTDIVRKKIFKTKKDKKRYYGEGIYTEEKKEKIYKKLFEITEKKLKNENNVIIDASFQKQYQRDKAKQIASKTNSDFIIIYCNPPEDKIKEWLVKRSKEKSISDARIEIFEDFKKNFDEVEINEDIIEIDTSNEDFFKEVKEKINNKLKSLL